MTNSLRKWQKDALDVYHQSKAQNSRSILWEATPGAGKTIVALKLCLEEIENHQAGRIIVIVPTSHLKLQWARAATQFKLDLDCNYGEKKARLAADYQGAVLTYQQIGNKPLAYRALANKAVVVLDEVHHAGDGLSWGNSLKLALRNSSFILCLSGTAFRSDNNPIPFVNYSASGISEPDYTYPYSSAVMERVCRPTVFFTYGGEVAWQDNGTKVSASFTDSLERTGSTKRLRAALDQDSGWMEPMLRDANKMLTAVREKHHDAGALLVASSQRHARQMAQLITNVTGERPTTVLSEDPSANLKLKRYTASEDKWLVACNMVSEGVDIPRLRIGVFATTIRTKMYFRQFLGRIVRKTNTPKGIQTAFFYLPADPWLKKLAEEIEDEQKHYLRNQEADDEWYLLNEGINERVKEEHENTWIALASENSGLESVITGGGQLSLWELNNEEPDPDTVYPLKISKTLKPNEFLSLSKSELKDEIAKEIRSLVTRYQRISGEPHSHIHAFLNRRQGLKNQNQCTESQLKERLTILESLIQR